MSAGTPASSTELRTLFAEYTALMKNHFWKENDILYPMARRVMSAADGQTVVAGIEATEASVGQGTRAKYYGLADRIIRGGGVEDLSFGVERDVMAAILNTLPVELSFVDKDDKVRYFSHENGEKIFPRTRGVIGMAVQNCHPEKSVHLVNRILADFKAGTRTGGGVLDRDGRPLRAHPVFPGARSGGRVPWARSRSSRTPQESAPSRASGGCWRRSSVSWQRRRRWRRTSGVMGRSAPAVALVIALAAARLLGRGPRATSRTRRGTAATWPSPARTATPPAAP